MIKDLKDIELFQFKDEELNNKKRNIKKIICIIVATFVYSVSLITSSFEIAGFFKLDKNICDCNNTFN